MNKNTVHIIYRQPKYIFIQSTRTASSCVLRGLLYLGVQCRKESLKTRFGNRIICDVTHKEIVKFINNLYGT